MSKHTPGPWVFAWGGGHALVFDAKGGPTIAAVPYDDAPNAVLAGANARLIASAPELLDALKAMLEQFNYNTITGLVHDESAAITLARRAVEKAEGAAQ